MPDVTPIVLQQIDLDIVPGKTPPIVHVSEYDTGRQILVNLFRDGYPFGTNSIESYTVKVEGTIGKYGFSEDASWASDAEGVVAINLTEAMTAIHGRVWTKIKLINSSGQQISTNGFWMDVDRAGCSNESVSPPSPGELTILPLSVIENGTFVAPTGKAYSPVTVNVSPPSPGELTILPLSVIENGTFVAPTGKAYSPVTVNVSQGGGDVVHASWHQCPEAVRNYLSAALAAYPTNGGATIIDQYAPNYINIPEDVSRANSKPIGYTVDGVTFYDNEPNTAEPFSTANKAGTLTALDWLRWYNTTLAAPATGSDYKRGYNCRDLGGWPCDGGTIRYGILVRGSEPNPADKELMVDKIGIMTEVQLLPLNEQADDYKMRSAWGIEWAGNDTENTKVYSPSDVSDPAMKALWAKILNAIISSVNEMKPTYFHCGIGADRTGVTAMILEGILGVSSDNVDIDFELTNFALGWRLINNSVYRGRAYPTFVDLKNGFSSIPLVGGLSDSFRNRCVSFALSLGITIDEINAFRAAMIDGTPEIITVSLGSYTVSKTTENVVYSNTDVSVEQFQDYETDIAPAAGYRIEAVTVTMGGVDITEQVFSGELAPPDGTVYITENGEIDVSAYETAHVSVPTGITPSGTKQITSTALTDVASYASAQVVDANLVAGNIKKDVSILGVTGTYEGSGGGGSSVNCKIFEFTSAAAVANQDVTVVSGDADVAAHYADPNAMVVIRKMTDNAVNGSSIILGTNHDFGGGSTSMYMNCNGTTNAAAVSVIPLTTASGSGVSVRCNANGDIIVHCGSKQNNFGGASYIIVFTW